MSMSPETFGRALSSFDPLLTVRWGKHIGQWVVERKSTIPNEEREFLRKRRARLHNLMQFGEKKRRANYESLWRQVVEEDEAAGAGRRVIVMPKVLDRRVLDALMWSDIRRYGGYSRMADEWEKHEQIIAADQQRVQRNEDMARHGEVFDILNFLHRKRSNELAHGERNLEVLLK